MSTAAIAPRPKRWANRLPRWLRVTLMAALFLCFFAACPLLALIILPALRLFLKDYRDKITWLLNKGLYVVIWWARFMGTVDFETPSPVPGINTVSDEENPWISDDLRTLFFVSDRGGSKDIYVATR